jgi:hypothetical protein
LAYSFLASEHTDQTANNASSRCSPRACQGPGSSTDFRSSYGPSDTSTNAGCFLAGSIRGGDAGNTDSNASHTCYPTSSSQSPSQSVRSRIGTIRRTS